MTADTSLPDQAECDQFIRRAVDSPDDDHNLLAFAGWLENHQQADAAQAIRQHVADCQSGGETADPQAVFRLVQPPAGGALSPHARHGFFRLRQQAADARREVLSSQRIQKLLSRPSQTAWVARPSAE